MKKCRVGFEIHVELNTDRKLFCGCRNSFSSTPNSFVCPVCLGYPGTLPRLNLEAVKKALKISLALKSKVSPISYFDRKNYFYPDIPKNYQITQYFYPLSKGGYLEIEKGGKRIRISRIHIEEDVGRIKHLPNRDILLIDFNRAGVPLAEIVTEPDIESPEEAHKFLLQMVRLLKWLNVSDCKMEEGSLRCDVNISIEGVKGKVEIKNLNSFKAVKEAIKYEHIRLNDIASKGEDIHNQTRGWNEETRKTYPLRSKEKEDDYRYFPEPDLPPLNVCELTEKIKREIPPLPIDVEELFTKKYGIPSEASRIITSDKNLAEFFEKCANMYENPPKISKWILSEVLQYINKEGGSILDTHLTPNAMCKMMCLLDEGKINNKIGKKLIKILLKKGGDPQKIIEEKGWLPITSRESLLPYVKETIQENPKALKEYLKGKEGTINFFIGEIMKKSRGRADVKTLKTLIKEYIKKGDSSI